MYFIDIAEFWFSVENWAQLHLGLKSAILFYLFTDLVSCSKQPHIFGIHMYSDRTPACAKGHPNKNKIMRTMWRQPFLSIRQINETQNIVPLKTENSTCCCLNHPLARGVVGVSSSCFVRCTKYFNLTNGRNPAVSTRFTWFHFRWASIDIDAVCLKCP